MIMMIPMTTTLLKTTTNICEKREKCSEPAVTSLSCAGGQEAAQTIHFCSNSIFLVFPDIIKEGPKAKKIERGITNSYTLAQRKIFNATLLSRNFFGSKVGFNWCVELFNPVAGVSNCRAECPPSVVYSVSWLLSELNFR